MDTGAKKERGNRAKAKRAEEGNDERRCGQRAHEKRTREDVLRGSDTEYGQIKKISECKAGEQKRRDKTVL